MYNFVFALSPWKGPLRYLGVFFFYEHSVYGGSVAEFVRVPAFTRIVETRIAEIGQGQIGLPKTCPQRPQTSAS